MLTMEYEGHSNFSLDKIDASVILYVITMGLCEKLVILTFLGGVIMFGVGMAYLPEGPAQAPYGMTAEEYSSYKSSIIVNSSPFKIAMSGIGLCTFCILYLSLPQCYSSCRENYEYFMPSKRVIPEPLKEIVVPPEKHLRPILKVTPQLTSQPAPSSSPPAQLVPQIAFIKA